MIWCRKIIVTARGLVPKRLVSYRICWLAGDGSTMSSAPPQKKARTGTAGAEGTALPFAAVGDIRLFDVPHVREYLPPSADAKAQAPM